MQPMWQQPRVLPLSDISCSASRFSNISLLQRGIPKPHPCRPLPFSAVAFCLPLESCAGRRHMSITLLHMKQTSRTGLHLTHHLATAWRLAPSAQALATNGGGLSAGTLMGVRLYQGKSQVCASKPGLHGKENAHARAQPLPKASAVSKPKPDEPKSGARLCSSMAFMCPLCLKGHCLLKKVLDGQKSLPSHGQPSDSMFQWS